VFLQLSLKLEKLTEDLLDTFVKGYVGATAQVAYMDSAYAFFATQLMLDDMRMEAGTFDPTTGDRTTFDRNTDRDSGYHLKPGSNHGRGGLDEFFEDYEWRRDDPGGSGIRGRKKKRRRGSDTKGNSTAAARERAIEKKRDRLRKLIQEILALLRAIFTDGV
jgi:hypothetical protein